MTPALPSWASMGPADRPRVLVVTSVHPPDDPRIRHKTVATLSERFTVRYATRAPGPTDRAGLEWVALPGPRPVRAAHALREMLRRDVDLVGIHDPELIPAGVLACKLRGIPVVFDMHEDYEARAVHADGHGKPHATPRREVARRLIDLADRHLSVTLAEPAYQRCLARSHPVLPNHPVAAHLPPPRPVDPSRPVVYVGDVTAERGMHVLLRGVALLDPAPPLVVVGRCRPALRRRLAAQASSLGVSLDLRGWRPHTEAMATAAGAAVAVCPLLDLPNYRHSLPTKVLEYLGMGVPVVASDLPGTTTVVAGLPGVHLVPPADPRALAAAISRAGRPGVRPATAANVADLLAAHEWPGAHLLALYADLLAGGRC